MADPRLTSIMEQLPRHIEHLQIMVKERGAAGYPLAAVRREEITRALAGTKNSLKSKQISAAPTQSDYNNLQSDVAMMYAMLTQIAETLAK